MNILKQARASPCRRLPRKGNFCIMVQSFAARLDWALTVSLSPKAHLLSIFYDCIAGGNTRQHVGGAMNLLHVYSNASSVRRRPVGGVLAACHGARRARPSAGAPPNANAAADSRGCGAA